MYANYIVHYGVGHKQGGNSGRYKWGSGKRPMQSEGGKYQRRQLSEEEKAYRAQKQAVIKSGSAQVVSSMKHNLTDKELQNALKRIEWYDKLAKYSQAEKEANYTKLKNTMNKVQDVSNWIGTGVNIYKNINYMRNAISGKQTQSQDNFRNKQSSNSPSYTNMIQNIVSFGKNLSNNSKNTKIKSQKQTEPKSNEISDKYAMDMWKAGQEAWQKSLNKVGNSTVSKATNEISDKYAMDMWKAGQEAWQKSLPKVDSYAMDMWNQGQAAWQEMLKKKSSPYPYKPK